MSQRRPFANMLALWQPNPARIAEACRRLSALEGVALPPAPEGWVVAIQCLPGTRISDVYNAEHGILLPQGADLLRPPGLRGPLWQELARDARDATRYCGQLTRGDFALAALQPRGAINVVQTHATLMPLFIASQKDWLAWATSLNLMAMACPEKPDVDRAILATWCNAYPLLFSGRSILKGVAEYPRGSRVRAQVGGEPRITNGDTEFLGPELGHAHLDRKACGEWLREAALDNLRRDLVADGVNLLALSCGRDSSTLAALVHQHLKLPLTTASLLPVDPETRARELAFAEPSLRGLPDGQRIVLDWPDSHYQVNILEKAKPSIQPTLHPLLCEMPGLLEKTAVDTYFGGEFCDELIGGEPVLGEWLADIGLVSALRKSPIITQRAPLTWKQVLRHRFAWLDEAISRLRGQLDSRLLHAAFDRSLQQEIHSLLARTQGRKDSPGKRMLIRYQRQYAPILTMNWEACALLGIRRSFPLATRETLSLLWSTRARHRLGPRTKELFTEAFKPLAPQAGVERADKGLWGGVLPEGMAAEVDFSDPAALAPYTDQLIPGREKVHRQRRIVELQKKLAYVLGNTIWGTS